jgi:hypothetical protein
MCYFAFQSSTTVKTMLKRQKGESLTELRLNLAIGRAHTEDILTEEINPANMKRP